MRGNTNVLKVAKKDVFRTHTHKHIFTVWIANGFFLYFLNVLVTGLRINIMQCNQLIHSIKKMSHKWVICWNNWRWKYFRQIWKAWASVYGTSSIIVMYKIISKFFKWCLDLNPLTTECVILMWCENLIILEGKCSLCGLTKVNKLTFSLKICFRKWRGEHGTYKSWDI